MGRLWRWPLTLFLLLLLLLTVMLLGSVLLLPSRRCVGGCGFWHSRVATTFVACDALRPPRLSHCGLPGYLSS